MQYKGDATIWQMASIIVARDMLIFIVSVVFAKIQTGAMKGKDKASALLTRNSNNSYRF